MPKLIPTLFLVLSFMLLLMTAPLPARADEETARLERWALCQAMPYRCPGYNPAQDEDPSLTQARQTNDLCARLAKSKERGTPAAVEEDRIRQTSCRDWQARQDRADGMTAATRRAIARSSSTLDCITTWDDRPYSSRLTTTCTSY